MAWLLDHLGGVEQKVMHDVVRLLTGSASDWLEDYFEHEAVKGYHASSSIIGSKVGPMSPGSGLVLLFHKMGEHDGHLGSWAFHKGGNGGFTQVLARAAEAFGAEIRLGSRVDSVITREGRAVGVALEDGTEFRAPVVVSALDPRRTFLDLVEPRELPADLVENIERMKFRGVSAKVNFALDGLPVFPALPDTVDHYGGFLNIGPTIEYVERAFDAAKYGWYSERPFIDAAIQSVVDPDMAPPGKHVMSCFVQYAPYELKGSDWETERESFGDKAQAVLESHFPGFGDLVLHREVVTPVDIERVTGLTEGNIFAGRVPRPADVLLPPRPGLEPVPHPDRRLLPVRLRHPPRRLRDRLPRQAGQPARAARPTIILVSRTANQPRVYAYRWVVLAAFMAVNLTIQTLWISYAPVSSTAQEYYGVSSAAIGALAISFMLAYLPFSFVASQLIVHRGFRFAAGLGALLAGVSGVARGLVGATLRTRAAGHDRGSHRAAVPAQRLDDHLHAVVPAVAARDRGQPDHPGQPVRRRRRHGRDAHAGGVDVDLVGAAGVRRRRARGRHRLRRSSPGTVHRPRPTTVPWPRPHRCWSAYARRWRCAPSWCSW